MGFQRPEAPESVVKIGWGIAESCRYGAWTSSTSKFQGLHKWGNYVANFSKDVDFIKIGWNFKKWEFIIS